MYPYGNYNQQHYQPYSPPGGYQDSLDYRQQPGYGMGQQGYGQAGSGYPSSQGSGGYIVPPPQSAPTTGPQVQGMLPVEESYVENILRLNKGKLATVYMTFEGSKDAQKRQQVFKGIIEAAGRDHLILSDPQTGMRYLLLMVYLDYITFDEEIEYDYPVGGGMGLANFSPR